MAVAGYASRTQQDRPAADESGIVELHFHFSLKWQSCMSLEEASKNFWTLGVWEGFFVLFLFLTVYKIKAVIPVHQDFWINIR